jgi:NadR type nicotinamide-nucleotide adenylyltransferase
LCSKLTIFAHYHLKCKLILNNLKKIVIIGPESTGKSTIAASLALHFDTAFVPEFARGYLDGLDRPYEYPDLLKIGKGQIALEEEKSKYAQNDILFCDTDLNVLKVWSEHKYGKCDPWILEQVSSRPYDFYLLTGIDMPWVPDPQREHPGPEMRAYFFSLYREIVAQSNCPWRLLEGNEAERLCQAVQIVEDFLGLKAE